MGIRDVIDSDWKQVYQLMEDNMLEMQSALGLKWNQKSIINHYKSKSVIVEEQNSNISGFIAYHHNDYVQFIDSLQVAKEYQNRLVGFRLLRTVLLKAISSPKIQTLRCCVFENNPAQALYFSVGFHELNRGEGILTLEVPIEKLVQRLKLAKT